MAEVAELNNVIGASITYTLPNEERVLDGKTLSTWLVRDSDGHFKKDEDAWNAHIQSFVEEMAAEVDSVGKERSFQATDIGEVTVSGGTYGYVLNQEEEIAQLTEELNNLTVTTREPVYSRKEVSTQNNGFGFTYVEVDLSRQHVWYYIDGELAVDTDCVSGMMTKGRYTPPGIFLLSFKATERDLKGPKKPDGSYEWISHVHYWMPFNKDIGLHDATWRYSFGGKINVYNGSHGCVNLPLSAAKTMYSTIDENTPIICYYSKEYSLR